MDCYWVGAVLNLNPNAELSPQIMPIADPDTAACHRRPSVLRPTGPTIPLLCKQGTKTGSQDHHRHSMCKDLVSHT